jgi:tripartite-type tricarboxylate transporter receptor subunit TctC
VSGVGPPSIASQFAHITKEFLVPNIKVVEYRSGAESWLAMERKEIDGLGDAFNNIKIRLERGEIRPLFRTRISQPGIENLPVNEDLTSDPTGKKIMAMHSIIGGSGRSCVFPPGTPANIVAILRNAFEKAIDDPELKEEAKKLQMDMEYVSAEKCLDIQKYVLSQPTEVVKEFSKFIKF